MIDTNEYCCNHNITFAQEAILTIHMLTTSPDMKIQGQTKYCHHCHVMYRYEDCKYLAQLENVRSDDT